MRWLRCGLISFFVALAPMLSFAAPYAALVMDARTGEILLSNNADTRLHPASLTKMMTLYIAFEAVERGEISLDKLVTISAKAASEPPSKLGLRSGQRIALRHLIRAAAIKSANDAATAIGEAISGSEAAFAERMNRTAKALGMNNTTFRNAHGLTRDGHLSTAHDMTILGRRLFYDYPEYYHLFSRRTIDAGVTSVSNTNSRFLDNYRGADGIKTGFTNAAGFNLTASAERGGKRIIATVFGGTSTVQRNNKMAELLNIGFERAPSRVQERRPAPPQYYLADAPSAAASTIRVSGLITTSPRPVPRPTQAPLSDVPDMVLAAVAATLSVPEIAAPEQVASAAPLPASPVPQPSPIAQTLAEGPSFVQSTPPQPETLQLAEVLSETEAEGPQFVQSTEPQPETLAIAAAIAPIVRPERLILAALTPEAPAPQQEREVIARVSSSGGRHWGISLGRFNTSYQAERVLLQTALMEIDTLGDALRKVSNRTGGFEANFVGLSQETAEIACRRLDARNTTCTVIGP